MRLTRLRLRDLGPFTTLDLPLPAGTDDERADVHLLVGPNGTGKTTLLQAVAQLFNPTSTGFSGRSRSERGVAVVDYDDGAKLGWGSMQGESPGVEVDGDTLGPLRVLLGAPSTGHHYGRGHGLLFHLHGLTGDELSVRRPRISNQDVVVFAYGTQRRAPPSHLQSLGPVTDNPLTEAALFDKPTSEGAFLQWIVNLIGQQAIAEKQGDLVRAARLGGTLDRVAQALAAVTGAPVRLEVRDDLSAVEVVLGDARVPHAQLAAGLGALLGWVGDLLMRLDRLPWQDDLPLEQREIVVLLDEVEIHLHPAWQRRVLPMVERLLPRAQILAATHSPFVIQSASDAWVHRFALREGRSELAETVRAPSGDSYDAILRDLLTVPDAFSVPIEERWARLRAAKQAVLGGSSRAEFDRQAAELAGMSDELYRLVAVEKHQLDRQLATRASRS